MESTATPAELLSWRFQMGLYRAYYDAYVRSRLINETSAENRALSRLAEIRRMGAGQTRSTWKARSARRQAKWTRSCCSIWLSRA